tara:strand:- start:204 stop:401 length:198 start_codon:yes stop_codon:yes gene_type:complete
MHSFEEANVIHVLSCVRKELTNVLPGLTVLFKLPQWFHYSVLDYFPGLGKGPAIIESHHFTIMLE